MASDSLQTICLYRGTDQYLAWLQALARKRGIDCSSSFLPLLEQVLAEEGQRRKLPSPPRTTGKPTGGRMPGAGRPKGAKDRQPRKRPGDRA